MNHFTRLSQYNSVAIKLSYVKNNRKTFVPSIIYLQHVSTRLSSDSIRFLDDTHATSLKRGAGGRSSFSGVTATVFGATGLLGRHVCNKLGKMGTQLIIPYRADPYEVRDYKLMGDLGQVLFTPFQIPDEDSIRRAVKHADVVVNLLGRDWHTRNFSIYQANAETAEKISRISKEMGVKKFVHVSALNCNVEHEGFLQKGGAEFYRAKSDSEDFVCKHYPDAIIFRPSDMYGQQDRFLRYYLRYFRSTIMRRVIALPYAGKDVWKQPVYVGNVASGIVNSIYNHNSLGQTYEAVGPRRYELCEFVTWIHRIIRCGPEISYFKLIDLKYDFWCQMKGKLFEKSLTYPVGFLSTDKFEREAVTDTTFSLPNLVDLGVELDLIEDRIVWETLLHAPFRVQNTFKEFPDVDPCPFVKA